MRIKALALFLFCTFFSFAQQIFQKTYGSITPEYGFSVLQSNDSGFVICGSINVDTLLGNTDVYLIKTSSFGDTLWTKTYGGSQSDFGEHVEQTKDGGYIIVGITNSFGIGINDIYVIKTDANGDTLWTKTYGTTNDDLGQYIQQTFDGGYIIAGHTESFGAGKGDFYTLKLNSVGDTTWTKTYGGSKHDHSYCVQQTNDSGYIFAGHSVSFGGPLGGFYAVKTNSAGDTLWTKVYGGLADSYCYAVLQTNDGGYIISGYTNSFGAGGNDFYVVKTNSGGDTLWTKTYGGAGEDYSNCIRQTKDGGYIILGTTSSFGKGGEDIYLIKTNNAGDTLWTRTFGGTATDNGFFVRQTIDGGYIISGTTNSFGLGNFDIYLIKTDSNGNSGCQQESSRTFVTKPQTLISNTSTQVLIPGAFINNTQTKINRGCSVFDACNPNEIKYVGEIKTDLLLYPNPTNGIFMISLNDFSGKIKITTILGETIYVQEKSFPATIDLNNQPAGTYFIELTANGKVYNRKVLVNK